MNARRCLATLAVSLVLLAPLPALAQEWDARQDAAHFDVEQQVRDASAQRTEGKWMAGLGVAVAGGALLLLAAPETPVVVGVAIVIAGLDDWHDAQRQLAFAASARHAAEAGAGLPEVVDLLAGESPAWSGTALRRDLSKRGALAPADGTAARNEGFHH